MPQVAPGRYWERWHGAGMRKWFRKFCSSGFFIPLVLLMPYVCTIVSNGADKALLLSSPDEEVMVPLLLMVQLKKGIMRRKR